MKYGEEISTLFKNKPNYPTFTWPNTTFTLSHFDFHPIKDDEGEIQYWTANKFGHTFEIYND